MQAPNLPPDSFYLVHDETGQRYSVRGQVIIGRNHGEIVFTGDPKLSSEHCLVSYVDGAIQVTDLNSGNGTWVDGRRIPNDATTKLEVGAQLRVGEQEFTLQVLSVARLVKPRRNPPRKREKEKPSSFFSYLMVFILCAVGAYVLAGRTKQVKAVSSSGMPADTLRELTTLFGNYDSIQASLNRDTAPVTEITSRFEREVVMPLQGLSMRLARAQMEKTNDQILIDLEKEYASSFSSAVHDYTVFLQTGDSQYLDQMDLAHDQMQKVNERFRKIAPRGMLLPNDLRSPQKLVEREMRGAFKTYRTIGESIISDHLNRKQAAQVRDELLPQLQAVLTRLGGVTPESNNARKRLEMEQRLVSSVLGQLKALLLYSESNDKKYKLESERWLSLVAKNRDELKDTIVRKPASSTQLAPLPSTRPPF